ncbi:hypothetical protein I204_03265 [Kwoniella mangroviensis CBS 8886]|nr:uncharacterized protein I203_00323 [Kwoniella mangroviensis CBS 8507]OCF70191.1 hypothetical protein I203_00323 [Kwoniella mangroviensis CBS 8507]OCF75968.1 hypothetical protein I204_03265 [Kwoniella mangroviensis CBS 8886]
MADHNQPRPRLRSTETSRSHPLATTPSHPSLTRRTSTGGGSGGAQLTPSILLPSGQDLSPSTHDFHPSTYHRPHANTISTARPSRRSGNGLSEAQLLGVESSRRSGHWSNLTSPNLHHHPIVENQQISRFRSPKRGDSSSSRLFGHLDSLSKEELAVVETRFDLMTDDELRQYIRQTPSSNPTPLESSTSESLDSSRDDTAPPRPVPADHPPLFPPSPPASDPVSVPTDHPLKVLSKAIAELREVIERLEDENIKLKKENAEKSKPKTRRKSADQISIHDGLTEAISTSLTSNSPISEIPSNPLVISSDVASVRSISPSPSNRKIRRPPSIASSLSAPFPSSPITPTIPSTRSSGSPSGTNTPGGAQAKKNNRSTWTSGLWAWSGAKKTISSDPVKEQGNAPIPTEDISTTIHESAIIDEDDPDAWRKGDGGSSPAFKAIFLATRIITPDPSSILLSSEIPSNSLIAYLAHSLISNARDDGIVARDAVTDRRRSRDFSRSRATSIGSQYPAVDPDKTREGKGAGYGDQALAATASLGRTLISSVSNATIRGTRAISSITDESRPSLLQRTSSSRAFPTTAISAPSAVGQSGSSATSPTEERPLPSVELSSIVPDDIRPPTVTLSRQNLGSFFQNTKTKIATASRFESEDEPLTDRYGFIYDIQHAKMLKDASAAGTSAPMSLNGTLAPAADNENEGWIAKRRRNSHGSQKSSQTQRERKSTEIADSTSIPSPRRSTDSARLKTPESGSPPKSRSSSHVDTHRHRSSTLLSLNPSPAKPVTAKDHLTVSSRGASSLQPAITPTSTTSPPLSASLTHSSPIVDSSLSASASRLTVSSLLEQLTETHDRQQQERLKEWDAFLRRRARHIHDTLSGSNHKSDDLRWGSGLIGINQMGMSGKGGQEDWKVFTRLVRKGIPLKYRSDVWAECSGAKDLMVPGEYAEILAVHKDDLSPVHADIEKDVSRTFPGNVFFGGDGPGVAKLRRVLTAYSWHNPAVGYCQGMNMLAATLLLTHTDEEQAYWVLTSLIDRLLPSQFYSASLLASRADQVVLNDLVAQLVPKIHNHLEELGVDLASVTFGWWLSLFTDCLPVETLFRVWDVTFVEGHDTLFRVAIAILKLNEAEIGATESVSDLFSFISNMTSRLWNADKLIAASHLQHSYKPIIRHIDIVARCEKAVAQLQKEMGDE